MSHKSPIPFSTNTNKPTTLSGYGITDGYPLSGNPSGFLSSLPNTYPQWMKITKAYTDFSTAGLSNTITIATLPAKSVVHSTIVNPTTTFVGGIISAYSVSVGMINTVDLMPASSVLTIPSRPFSSSLTLAGTIGSTQAITATAIAVTGLLNAATQGSVDIYLLVSILP